MNSSSNEHRLAGTGGPAPLPWGREGAPGDYRLVAWLFLRVIALIYLAAFASLVVQIPGLIGADGLLPAGEFLAQARKSLGGSAMLQIPTLFWFDASDFALTAACSLGMAAALAVFLDVAVLPALALCYVLYLSLVHAGREFLAFQWDMFLLESGFLALFLTFGSPIVIWLYRWLLFRFMFMGGVVKLASGDPAWRNLTALKYHFETQPLPSPLAWYGQLLPDYLLQFGTACVFVIELLVPFFVFLPRRWRLRAAASFLLLQGMIMLTGNYNFFNILTISLCVFLLDDRDVRPWLGKRLVSRILACASPPGALAHRSAAAMAVVVLTTCGTLLWLTNTRQRPIQPFDGLLRLSATLGIVNGYGPFAIMTTERHEIILESSNDGEVWLPYAFKYKPGNPGKPLTWNIPHQPRLDWQMWFAALDPARGGLWFNRLMTKLHKNSEPVLSLLQESPLSRQPRYVRASVYRYAFTGPEERSASGQIWHREYLGEYPLAGR